MPTGSTQAPTEVADPLIGGRYELLDPVGAGALGEVFRARDRLTEREVALKRVHRRFWLDATEAQVALAHEFSVLASLRHPHVISVLDYGFESSGRPFYTMTYLERAEDIRAAATGRSPEAVVELIFQVLQALAYLHRQGLLHRDLKPSNILVRDDHVTVLDFNLASTPDHMVEGGTPHYMAPEILDGASPTTASDLYAVGVIAYEMLAGQLPFKGRTVASVLASTMAGDPTLEPLGVGERMRTIVRRLLSRDPGDRFGDANRLIEAFADAAGLAVPIETAALRDSYVRAAGFVGRRAELDSLTMALDEAKSGSGSAWLLAGESGIGKSRLLGQLRPRALVEGFVVLRGQAVRETGKPYELLRWPTLRLLLEVDVSDEEAAVLNAAFPGVERIMGRAVPEPPPLDPEGVAHRLAAVIERVFSRITRPVLLEVEDCHWAYEGLHLLDRLVEAAPHLPLVIIGTYRDDERPEIAARLDAMQVIALQRFGPEEIAELGVSMLGDSLDRDHRLVAFLARESEGNAFFLTEAVRAVAEEVGRLDQVRSSTLPENVFSEGMRSLMLRRLEKLPPSSIPGLRASALIGRRIDPRLLSEVLPEIDLESWLALCGGAAVLEPHGYGWRFSHDKLRDIILEEIDPDTRQALHRSIAEAIEAMYGTDSPDWIPALAIHWEGAGVAEKAIPNLMKAALQLFAEGAAAETVRLTAKTVRLLGFELPEPDKMGEAIPVELGRIQELMADRSPADLADLPALDDEAVETVIEVLAVSIPGAHQSHQFEAFAMAVLRSVSLTLEYGVGPHAPFAFACYAILVRAMTGDTALALEFVRLARTWDEQRLGGVSGSVGFVHAWFVNHWQYHPAEGVPLLREAADAGEAAGDAAFACFSNAAIPVCLRVAGRPLDEVIQASREAVEAMQHRVLTSDFHAMLEGQVAKALSGRTSSLLSLTDDEYDEERDLASICRTSLLTSVAYYYGAKSRLHYLNGDAWEALDFAEKEGELLAAFAGQLEQPDYTLFHGLGLAAVAEISDPERKRELLARAGEFEGQLASWAETCEGNFRHKAMLLRGAIARADGDLEGAARSFEEAVDHASAAGFAQYVALGHELAARTLRDAEQPVRARERLEAAVDAYTRWGATAKAEALVRDAP